MKVLVIGSGGREHALAHQFLKAGHTTYCSPGNGGTQATCEPLPSTAPPINLSNISSLVALANSLKPDLVVIGPEKPLALGGADELANAGFKVFGPKKVGAQLESSKSFAKTFMQRYGIPTARFISTKNPQQAQTAAARFCQNGGGVVVKPSGLTAGKGVTLCDEYQEACQVIDEMMENSLYGEAGHELVVEERMSGPEISILALCDGKSMVPLIPAQDHKPLLEGDKGPNTGGMGAYAPTPFATREIMDQVQAEIIDPTLRGMQGEGMSYQGVLYFGLMLTTAGPKVLEFNCRFGDPETQAVLPLLESDLAEIMLRCIDGDLTQASVVWQKKHAACVVVASKGYPRSYEQGKKITGLEFLEERENVIPFHAGTIRDERGNFTTTGGRVVGITGLGSDLETALARAYEGVERIGFEGKTFRTDIGYQALAALTSCV